MKTLFVSSGLFLLLLLFGLRAEACRFTPLEWQQTVERAPHSDLRGQRKHTSWSRDRNGDFIDDRIPRRFKPGQRVDIIVDLNQCVTPEMVVRRFSQYGRISHIGRFITYVIIEDVGFEELSQLARMDDVAMIEWQSGGHPANDVSTRAVQSRKSTAYSPSTAEDVNITGNGVTIAIVDSGVDEAHKALAGKFVAGFDASKFVDLKNVSSNTNVPNSIDDDCEVSTSHPQCEPWSGSNPTAVDFHGTHVAATALGNDRTCASPDGTGVVDCSGTAASAKLVDIKVCEGVDDCDEEDVAQGLEWLAYYADAKGIRVANLSLAYCDVDKSTYLIDEPDDGTSALAQQVNYLVATGVVAAVAHGNASRCGALSPGDTYSLFPGSASEAITVAASQDMQTIDRQDDEVWQDGYLQGPRAGFDPNDPDNGGLKPDLAAPGKDIYSALYNTTDDYYATSGTSQATPHVAGAAALIIEARPGIDPGGVKDLLLSHADRSRSVHPYGLGGELAAWDTAFGWGLLKVFEPVKAASTSDVSFPSCVGAGAAPGQPCALTAPLQPWNNQVDITTLAPPQADVDNTIFATVHNAGGATATINVNFGVYVFAVGNKQFFHIGTQRVTLNPNETRTLSEPWKPADSNHQCVQVTIDFGLDTNFGNNITQRNLQVLPQTSPAIYEVQIENPFMVPALLKLDARSDRGNWVCRVDQPSFKIDPFTDCPRKVRVQFEAPAGAAPGEFANCNIAVTATPEGGRPVVIGGVTAQTFVPKPCRMTGQLVDAKGQPIRDARIRVMPAPPASAREEGARLPSPAPRPAEAEPFEASTDDSGVFSGSVTPHVPQIIEVSHEDLRGALETRFLCGIEKRNFVLTREGLSLEK